ncbi:hypothetical protein Q0590_30770 [Rhodocytophaga aerolata]|uniref:Uncharacterized protein n=1 Tax=Rhodocytophaga aerolata TaxID=455078 RepID=A0ABT8RF24_9BACT|nr:hypothetical protein [Rhodocytophaga aerolata]MDO1450697.1 hypothetical protein [Rhodocytophaga aerolata]
MSHIQGLSVEQNPTKVYEFNCTFPGGIEAFHQYLTSQILLDPDLQKDVYILVD